jgi:hypothetical protein
VSAATIESFERNKMAKSRANIPKIKSEIARVVHQCFDEHYEIKCSEEELLKAINTFFVFFTPFAQDLRDSPKLGTEEKNWIALFYHNWAFILFNQFITHLENIEDNAAVQKWLDAHRKRIRFNYHFAKNWYAAAGDDERSQDMKLIFDALSQDLDIVKYQVFTKRVLKLQHEEASAALTPKQQQTKTYLIATLKQFMATCTLEKPSMANSGRLADTTWAMIAADEAAYVPGLICELAQIHPEAMLASIAHEDRNKCPDSKEKYFGFNVTTLAARSGRVAFARDVVATLKEHSPHVLPSFINAVNCKGKYQGASALMLAVDAGRFEFVKLLLDNGANYLLKNSPASEFYPSLDALSIAISAFIKHAASEDKEIYLDIVILLLVKTYQDNAPAFNAYLATCYHNWQGAGVSKFREALLAKLPSMPLEHKNIIEKVTEHLSSSWFKPIDARSRMLFSQKPKRRAEEPEMNTEAHSKAKKQKTATTEITRAVPLK